jgi:hypothetical protein
MGFDLASVMALFMSDSWQLQHHFATFITHISACNGLTLAFHCKVLSLAIVLKFLFSLCGY